MEHKINMDVETYYERDDTKEALLKLVKNNQISKETFKEIYAEESEEEPEDYCYVYKVSFNIGLATKRFYFLNAVDTHFAFEYHNTKVRYIRTVKSSPQYQSAYYNTKTNNRIRISGESDNTLYFIPNSLEV